MPSLARASSMLVLFAAAATAAAEPIEVTGAWARATPPGATTAAAYLTVVNHGMTERLLGAASPTARAVQIHTQVTDGHIQRMVGLADIVLPAGDAVRFEPGKLHFMLLDIAAPLNPGTTIELTLRFAAAAPLSIRVPVVDARINTPPTHEHP